MEVWALNLMRYAGYPFGNVSFVPSPDLNLTQLELLLSSAATSPGLVNAGLPLTTTATAPCCNATPTPSPFVLLPSMISTKPTQLDAPVPMVSLKRTASDVSLIPLVNGFDIGEPKKARMDAYNHGLEPAPAPSPVVHIRRLPTDVTESEVVGLAIPFGPVENMVVIKKSGQALLQTCSKESATVMVEYYARVPAIVRGHQLIFQYSKYVTLATSGSNPHVVEAIRLGNEQTWTGPGAWSRTAVLRVLVEKWEGQALGHLLFYKVFHRFGRILRIVVFKSKDTPQALVEFEEETVAHVTKLQMSGHQLYPGGCYLRIDFSRQTHLEIQRESDSCRDYIMHPLTVSELAQFVLPWAGADKASSPTDAVASSLATTLLHPLMTQVHAMPPDPSQPHMVASSYHQLVPFLHQTLSEATGAAMNGGRMSMALAEYSNRNGGVCILPGSDQGPSPVLIVSNLNVEKVAPDVLFTLFGVYGDVLRVKILYNKPDTALIQFCDSSQAKKALVNLNGIPLYSRPLRCNFSRHQSVHVASGNNNGHQPTEDQKLAIESGTTSEGTLATNGGTSDPASALNKDYTGSNLHRFKRGNSRNQQNIFPPSCVLHVTGLPEQITEPDLVCAFQQAGHSVVKCKLLLREKKMALVQLESVEKGVAALISMHNFPLTVTNRLRVSFSRPSLN